MMDPRSRGARSRCCAGVTVLFFTAAQAPAFPTVDCSLLLRAAAPTCPVLYYGMLRATPLPTYCSLVLLTAAQSAHSNCSLLQLEQLPGSCFFWRLRALQGPVLYSSEPLQVLFFYCSSEPSRVRFFTSSEPLQGPVLYCTLRAAPGSWSLHSSRSRVLFLYSSEPLRVCSFVTRQSSSRSVLTAAQSPLQGPVLYKQLRALQVLFFTAAQSRSRSVFTAQSHIQGPFFTAHSRCSRVRSYCSSEPLQGPVLTAAPSRARVLFSLLQLQRCRSRVSVLYLLQLRAAPGVLFSLEFINEPLGLTPIPSELIHLACIWISLDMGWGFGRWTAAELFSSRDAELKAAVMQIFSRSEVGLKEILKQQ
ncbi:unnamed protein product [Arctogadus glacialis]